jgi:phosphate transport system permease protein
LISIKKKRNTEATAGNHSILGSDFIELRTASSLKRRFYTNSVIKYIFLGSAFFAGLFVFFITLFLIVNSAEFFTSWESFQGIVFEEVWEVNLQQFGSKNLVIGSLLVTIYASIIVIPLGIFIGIYLAEIASPRLKNILKPTIELISAMPSIVLGLLAIKYLTKFTRWMFNVSSGYLAITASMALAFMTIPFIASLTDDALTAVPLDLKKASLALGSSKWEVIKNISIPYSSSSIISATILAFGRIIGETMVVAMVTALTWNLTAHFLNPIQGVFPIPAVIAREYGNVNPTQIEYNALAFIGLELLIIAFFVTMIGRSIAKGRLKFPSFRKIINTDNIAVLPYGKKTQKSNIFHTRFGKISFSFWIITSIVVVWDIVSNILMFGTSYTHIITLCVSIIALASVILYFLSFKMKLGNNKLITIISGIPLAAAVVQMLFYLIIGNLNVQLSWFVLLIVGFIVFFTTTHAFDKTIESEKQAKKIKELERIKAIKETSTPDETSTTSKNAVTIEGVDYRDSFSNRIEKISQTKKTKEKIYFIIFGFFNYFAVALIIAIIVAVCIDGIGIGNPDYQFSVKDIFLVGQGTQHFGFLPSILGSVFVVLGSSIIGLPLSTLAGIYLHFYVSPTNRIGQFVRNSIQNIASVPSVVVGLFGWGIFVLAFGWGHSLLAGAATLSIMMIPIATATTIKALEQVPDQYRLNALAMGATKWESIKGQTLRYAMPSILTGYLFSISRVIGETAPIMLTVAVANVGTVFPTRLTGQGVAMLPFTIWYLALFTPGTGGRPTFGWAMSGAMLLLLISAIIYIIGQILRARLQVRYE